MRSNFISEKLSLQICIQLINFVPRLPVSFHQDFGFGTHGLLDIIESSKMKDAWNKNLMNISQLITFDRAVMTYKIVNQLCPEGLQNKFIERSVISKYNTRNRRDFHVQKLKLEYTKRGFLYTGPIAWNNISQSIRDTDSIVRFKKTKISPFELTESAPHESMEDQAIYFKGIESL